MILSSPFCLPQGRLIALDLGQARTGVAICDDGGMLASPFAVLRRHATRAQDFADIKAIVVAERVVGVLIGMPVGSDGGAGSQERWTRRYAGRLAGTLPIPVAFWDESLSTCDAHVLLREGTGRTGVDSAAAALILAEYLEARRAREGVWNM